MGCGASSESELIGKQNSYNIPSTNYGGKSVDSLSRNNEIEGIEWNGSEAAQINGFGYKQMNGEEEQNNNDVDEEKIVSDEKVKIEGDAIHTTNVEAKNVFDECEQNSIDAGETKYHFDITDTKDENEKEHPDKDKYNSGGEDKKKTMSEKDTFDNVYYEEKDIFDGEEKKIIGDEKKDDFDNGDKDNNDDEDKGSSDGKNKKLDKEKDHNVENDCIDGEENDGIDDEEKDGIDDEKNDDIDVGVKDGIDDREKDGIDDAKKNCIDDEEKVVIHGEEKVGIENNEKVGIDEKEKPSIDDEEKSIIDDEEKDSIDDEEKIGIHGEEKVGIENNEKIGIDEKEKDSIGYEEKDSIGDAEKDCIGDAEKDCIGDAEKDCIGDAENQNPDKEKHNIPDDSQADCGYVLNASGLKEIIFDYRHEYLDKDKTERPEGAPTALYLDTGFLLKLPKGHKHHNMEWKRPKEFRKSPILCSEKTSRSDVGQGSVGNCWFMAALANIADNKELMSQVLPKSAYYIEHPDLYDGIFHARFFSFGKWLDVYVDDLLPVSGENLLGAKSKTDDSVMWVPLVEKAFAKLHGSYVSICSGRCGDAFLQLTGGIGEDINHKDMQNTGTVLFDRIKNALQSNHQVTTDVSEKNNGVEGLIGNHAYSVVGVRQMFQSKLIKIRNPWGTMDWRGAWSDKSNEWRTIPENTDNLPEKDQGEFFVCLDDYMRYFEKTTICSMTPDFDMDGRCNLLKYVLNIYGEWFLETAAGQKNLVKNPRFYFVVTDQGKRDDGKVPIFVQMIQQCQRRETDVLSIMCDILKVSGNQDVDNSDFIVVEAIHEGTCPLSAGLQFCHRFKLQPGQYIIIPTSMCAKEMKAFLLRIFSPTALQSIREIPQDVEVTSCKMMASIDWNGETHLLTQETFLIGKFSVGVNDGGNVNEKSHHTNPQYVITVPDTGHAVPLVIQIIQKHVEPQYSLGLHLYKVSEDKQIPLKLNYLRKHYDECELRMDGQRHQMYIAWDMTLEYLLSAGKYVAVVYLDKPGSEKEFAVFLKSSADLGIRGLQTGSCETKT